MIDYANKELFNTASIKKNITITGPDFVITNDNIFAESLVLSESLNSEDELFFGSCEASCFKITINNVFDSLIGKQIKVELAFEGYDSEPFEIGHYTVVSDQPTADSNKRELTCFDALYFIINSDVAAWYKNITFPLTLKAFRDSFFNYFGIIQDSYTLTNDSMTVEKTIDPEEISGAEVIQRICEINGCFGHIGRNGHFQYITLGNVDDYESDNIIQDYEYTRFENYFVSRIDKLQVRQNADDIGSIVGSGDNAYIVEDNFLVYGKNASDLATITTRLFNTINDITYNPIEVKAISNLCFEVGDIVIVNSGSNVIKSFILEREVKGIQTLFDTIYSQGYPNRIEQVYGANYEIKQLKGKTNELVRNVEETYSKVTDLVKEAESLISQTAEMIKGKVSERGGDSSFSWELISTGFSLKSNDNEVFKADSSGIEVKGSITANSGYIGSSSQGFSIGSRAIYNGINSVTASSGTGIYIGTDGINLGGGKFKVTSSGELTSKEGTIGGFTITDSSIYNGKSSMNAESSQGVYIGTDGISIGSYGFKVDKSGSVTIGNSANLNTVDLYGSINMKGLTGSISRSGSEVIGFSGSGTTFPNALGYSFTGPIKIGATITFTADETIYLNSKNLTIDGASSTSAQVLKYTSSSKQLDLGIGITAVRLASATGKLGFFGHTANSRTTVSNKTYSSSTTASTVGSDLNTLKTALRDLGLIG